MKKIYILLFTLFLINFAKAQWHLTIKYTAYGKASSDPNCGGNKIDTLYYYTEEYESSNDTTWQWVSLSDRVYYYNPSYYPCFSVYGDKIDSTIIFFVEESELKKSKLIYNIYPNPTTNKITIDISNNLNPTLSIYNSIGELLLQRQLSNNKNEIDISNLSKGIYLIKIESTQGIVQQKLLKE